MEEKQTRLLVWLVGLLAVLVAVITLVQPGDDDKQDDDYSRAWPEVQADQVRSLRIQSGDSVLELKREDAGDDGELSAFNSSTDRWTISSPVACAADTAKVDALVDHLVSTEIGEDLQSADAAQFGLDDSATTITATLDDGQSISLKVGQDTVVGWGSYVQIGDSSAVHATRRKASNTLVKGLDDLRSKALLSISPSAVDQIELTWATHDDTPARTLRLQQDDHGWWVSAAATEARRRASEDAVRALLSGVTDLRVDRFLDGPGATPSADITVSLRAGDDAQVLVMSSAEDGRRLVQAPLPSGPVEVISDGVDDLLVADLAPWLATDLLPVHTSTLDAITVKLDIQGDSAAHRLEAHRAANGWEPAGAEDLLMAIQSVRVDRSQIAQPEGEPWGILTLTEGGNRVESVSLHQQIEGRGRVAISPAGGPGFIVPQTEIRRLMDAIPAAG